MRGFDGIIAQTGGHQIERRLTLAFFHIDDLQAVAIDRRVVPDIPLVTGERKGCGIALAAGKAVKKSLG